MNTYVNVGIVGHVSNGKTTLVNALTEVDTKRSSSEKKSGRTIKLGYANCGVFKCGKCGKIETASQSTIVECCGEELKTTKFISFVDAPGHHSFVTTMIKGATVVDWVILITDVRKDKLQPQTMEHLIILQILGISNIIVVQNKIDLVSSERCTEHSILLKSQLQDTIAENAPIIPISAGKRIGLDNLKNMLFRIVNDKPLTSDKQGLSIIRSFDINRPSTGVNNIKGGVLGVTVLGNSTYKIGDIIEIKPVNVKGKLIPVKTTIKSIFAENMPISEIRKGGLYGIGTTLDPSLTKNDYLSGCIGGFTDELPEVKSELELKIKYLKHTISENKISKLKNGQNLILVLGNTVVKGSYLRDGKISKIQFIKPICTPQTTALIYSEINKEICLIGYSRSSIARDEYSKSLSEQSQIDYSLSFHEHQKPPEIRPPAPKLMRENRNIIWSNISDFAEHISRTDECVVDFLREEILGREIVLCSHGVKFYKLRINATQLQNVLKKFLREKVVCNECRCLDTRQTQNGKIRYVECQFCKSIRPLSS